MFLNDDDVHTNTGNQPLHLLDQLLTGKVLYS